MGGTSNYHSVQAGVNHRLSRGLSVQLAYTFSKQLEKLRYVEPSDPEMTQMIGQFDNPHRLSAAVIYELPFGRRSMRTDVKAVDKIIGGWQWSAGIYQTSGGLPAAAATGTSPEIDNPPSTSGSTALRCQ
jgi:hypothetical protein